MEQKNRINTPSWFSLFENYPNFGWVLNEEQEEMSRRIEIMDTLIQNGVDINQEDDQGNTVLSMILKNTSDTPLINHMVLELFERGLNPFHLNKKGDSILLIAAEYGRWLMVDTLIEKGCSLNLKNKAGLTVLETLQYQLENAPTVFSAEKVEHMEIIETRERLRSISKETPVKNFKVSRTRI